ncbi:uncharacterized protein LOC118243038 [Electrophorus electricus]|uniref:uncharacterized protein LOC118243038 n=1 Tax=Electrophorus electricus TaxID=8005 RepID=UPI0015D01261|nr:uncharacterized protein LOC118243038 [Electrophorus electricus]
MFCFSGNSVYFTIILNLSLIYICVEGVCVCWQVCVLIFSSLLYLLRDRPSLALFRESRALERRKQPAGGVTDAPGCWRPKCHRDGVFTCSTCQMGPVPADMIHPPTPLCDLHGPAPLKPCRLCNTGTVPTETGGDRWRGKKVATSERNVCKVHTRTLLLVHRAGEIFFNVIVFINLYTPACENPGLSASVVVCGSTTSGVLSSLHPSTPPRTGWLYICIPWRGASCAGSVGGLSGEASQRPLARPLPTTALLITASLRAQGRERRQTEWVFGRGLPVCSHRFGRCGAWCEDMYDIHSVPLVTSNAACLGGRNAFVRM